jgi:hypothetical protein
MNLERQPEGQDPIERHYPDQEMDSWLEPGQNPPTEVHARMQAAMQDRTAPPAVADEDMEGWLDSLDRTPPTEEEIRRFEAGFTNAREVLESQLARLRERHPDSTPEQLLARLSRKQARTIRAT